jgi:hypothetical protein
MSNEVIGILLLAVAGFLIGGVYVTWKTAKMFAIALLFGTLLAAGAAVTWFLS